MGPEDKKARLHMDGAVLMFSCWGGVGVVDSGPSEQSSLSQEVGEEGG